MKGTVVVGSGNTTPSTLTIKTDKTSYRDGDLVKISGTGFSSTKTINIRIADSSGYVLTELSLSSTSTGSFQTLWPIAAGLTSDSYKITAIENTKSVSTTIAVTETQIPDDPVDPIMVITDSDSYSGGDTISIYGEVGERLSGYDVTLQIFAANGN
jgi:flagellar hook assembly protein FlgD